MGSSKKKILVVDDIPTNIMVLTKILSSNYDVYMATNGHKALKIAAAQLPDLILLDIMMPEMDGYEVCEKLKSKPATKNIPIIFISAKNQVEDVTKGLSLGAIDYITKPFEKAIVQARLKNHLSLKWHRDELQNAKNQLESKVEQRTAELNNILEEKGILMQELRHAKEIAEAANLAKSRFLSRINHELRTPLHQNLGFLEIISKKEHLTDNGTQFLANALQAGNKLLELLDNILRLSEAETGQLQRETARFNPRAIIDDIINSKKQDAENKGINIKCLTDTNVPNQANGMPAMVKQILSHIINNAIKFTEEGEIIVHTMAHKLTSDRYRLDIFISDTGIGIAKEQHDRIFDMFSQVDETNARKYAGAGLGLAICRQLAECMGGTITVNSELGKGCEFLISITLNGLENAS